MKVSRRDKRRVSEALKLKKKLGSAFFTKRQNGKHRFKVIATLGRRERFIAHHLGWV